MLLKYCQITEGTRSFTNGVNHTGFSCVSLHWDHTLEAMKGDNSKPILPYINNMLHFFSCLKKTHKFIHIVYNYFSLMAYS